MHTYFLISSDLPTLCAFCHVQLDLDHYLRTNQWYTKWHLKVQMQLTFFSLLILEYDFWKNKDF